MPSLTEVQYYLTGLWLLLRRDPRGFQYLDMSERGTSRSFWAIVWCIPATAISWIWWHQAYLRSMPPTLSTGPVFFVRLAMVEIANWILPLVLAGLLSLVAGLGRRFHAIVVVSNWLSVPFAYAYALVVLLVMFVPGSEQLASILWLALMAGLIFCLMRVVSMICGAQPLLVATMILVLVVPTMLLTDYMQSYLGLSIY